MKAPCPSLEQYEALRQHALGREPVFSSEPLGAILVVKTGVAGWIREWRRPPGEAAPARPVAMAPSAEPDWQHELTLVLAQITARHLSSPPS
jgi:hypothetical protein